MSVEKWVISRAPNHHGAYGRSKVYWTGSIATAAGSTIIPNITRERHLAGWWPSRLDALSALTYDDRLARQGFRVEAA